LVHAFIESLAEVASTDAFERHGVGLNCPVSGPEFT
jgi:hypothetical protein